MSFWVYCNSCFLSAAADRQLAVTTCGHVICSVCYQKGKQKNCLICSSQCQISPLSDKSSSEVKTLFSDINVVTTKHLTEISKVISFQSRHQRKLLTHYKKRNEKLEETFVKMKQEMQNMARKLNEQSVYIAKMEKSLQHQSAMAPPVSQMSRASFSAHVQKPALQIPYNSPAPLLRHFPTTNNNENTEVDEMSLFRKPNSVSRLSVNKPPQDGRMGAVSSRPSSQNIPGFHSSQSPSVSRFQGAPLTHELSAFNHRSAWTSPIFKPSSSFRGSISSLVCPSP
uniref:Ring finger protein 212 n=1 Tax=Oryzias latipes TaxID=8090 RepID=A0A3P9I531_ORYLA